MTSLKLPEGKPGNPGKDAPKAIDGLHESELDFGQPYGTDVVRKL